MTDTTESSGTANEAHALALEVRRLAHDLNNVLMPILLGIETLRRKAPQPELERTFNNIELSTRRATELAAELLTLGRNASGE